MFASSAPNAAQTAKWKEIGKTMVGNPVLLDPKSVKKDSAGIVTATLRVTFVKPVATPKGPITASRTVAMFDCKKHIVAVKDNTYYHDEKANRIYEHSAPKIPGFAAPFQGYGQTVIVQHAGRAFTLYAGLSETRAAAGGVVSLGQVVGVAGDSLYFEIRIDNKPEDPRLWLREQR